MIQVVLFSKSTLWANSDTFDMFPILTNDFDFSLDG